MRRLQQLSGEQATDVVAIQQVLYHYAYALDARDYDALDDVFAPDAQLHTSGGTLMSPAQYKTMCATELPKLDALLSAIAQRGVPNYFGEQRFGREGDNVERALAWLRGNARIPRGRLPTVMWCCRGARC